MEIIAIEGADGVGKSTQIDLLKEALEKENFSVVKAHPFDSTECGKFVRQSLLEDVKMSCYAQLALFSAAHIELYEQISSGALFGGEDKRPDVILIDRSPLSLLAYQQEAIHSPAGLGMFQAATRFFTRPSLCFVLEVPPETAMVRTKGEDAFERDTEFQQTLQDKFKHAVDAIGLSAVFIDGDQPPLTVHELIKTGTLHFLQN